MVFFVLADKESTVGPKVDIGHRTRLQRKRPISTRHRSEKVSRYEVVGAFEGECRLRRRCWPTLWGHRVCCEVEDSDTPSFIDRLSHQPALSLKRGGN